MNRRQKIIVSVTGIFIVLLILIGLTYAYFLTRIVGNPNTSSISVTTANLELVYGDGNGILNATNIEPGNYITFIGKNADGKTFETEEKTFSVENTGNVSISYGIYLEDVINEFKRYDDMVLTLECTSTKTGNACEGYNGTFPRIDALVLTNKIEAGEKHNYTLKVQYKEMYVDQSIDMNKTLSAKVQLYGLNNILDNENSLAYKIIENAKSGNGNTIYRNVPLSLPAQEITTVQQQTVGSASTVTLVDSSYYTYASEVDFNELSGYSLVNPQVDTWANIKSNPSKLASFKYLRRENGKTTVPSERTQTIKDMVRVDNISENTMTYSMLELAPTEENIEKTLSATLDDYGISYYYRGNVEDNYVNYNGMCWRIVRIEGDGSVKLLLESKSECSSTMKKNDGFIIVEDSFRGIYGADKVAEDVYIPNYVNPTYKKDQSMRYILNNWLETNNFDTSDLRKGDWCLGNLTDAYDGVSSPYNKFNQNTNELISSKTRFFNESYIRLYRQYPEKATLVCSNGVKVAEDYIGSLTLDEITFAGSKYGYKDYGDGTNYLRQFNTNVWSLISILEFTTSNGIYFGTNVVYTSTTIFALESYSEDRYELFGVNFRPSIALKNTITYVSGNGTIDSPYVVE